MEAFYVVLWLFLAAFIAIAAAGRGRSAVIFFFASLFLSPLIALVILLVIGPDQTKLDSRKLSGGESKKCPYCAEIIKAEAKVCRYCGRSLTTKPVATPVAASATPDSPDAEVAPPNVGKSQLLPAAEFASVTGIELEEVVNRIRQGMYRGRMIGDRWYVDRRELP